MFGRIWTAFWHSLIYPEPRKAPSFGAENWEAGGNPALPPQR